MDILRVISMIYRALVSSNSVDRVVHVDNPSQGPEALIVCRASQFQQISRQPSICNSALILEALKGPSRDWLEQLRRGRSEARNLVCTSCASASYDVH